MAKLSDVVPRSEARDELDERLSQRFIALDPKGYFLIKVDHASAELVLEHYGNTIDDKGLAHDPETGEVLSCKGGNGQRKPSGVYRGLDGVLNGIAVTQDRPPRMFVTGKLCPFIYEIELVRVDAP